MSAGGDILLTGYKAADLDKAVLAPGVTCHVLDIYHKHAIKKVFPGANVVCSADLPEGNWSLVRFRTGPKLCSAELSLDILQQCYGLGCPVELDFVGRERDRNELLAKIRDNPGRKRSFRAEWKASVPGVPAITLVSYPGCFCHRRMDEGGLALAEVVSRELKESGAESPAVLDMGCGCGLVGFLVKSAIPGASLVMVDSHSRAIAAAKENSKLLGMDAEFVLSDDGTDRKGIDVFVGNPPYYSEYRIADLFLETAQRALKPGGVCYTVCKNAAGLEPVQRRRFGNVEVIPRRGYAVLKSIAQRS